jgi:predicted ATPase
MSNFVKSIDVIGLHKRFDIRQEFESGINILYGKNGVGKTTILHILINALNSDYKSFFNLDFNVIRIQLADGFTIKLFRLPELDKPSEELFLYRSDERNIIPLSNSYIDDDYNPDIMQFRSYKTSLPAAYYPAFRMIIEAWTSLEEEQYSQENIEKTLLANTAKLVAKKQKSTTSFARKLFGQFLPQINYPSIVDITQDLARELRTAIFSIARIDQEILSNSFNEIFEAQLPSQLSTLIEKPEIILEQIYNLSEEIESHPLRGKFSVSSENYKDLFIQCNDAISGQIAVQILKTHRSSLEKIIEIRKKSYSAIKKYLDAVNIFLEDKRLETFIHPSTYEPSIHLVFHDDTNTDNFKILSSGERQIITLIYAAHVEKKEVVLIDEPEISLNLDWQRAFLKRIYSQLQDKQIIVCTHSPMIVGNYRDYSREINLMPTDQNNWIKNRDELDMEVEREYLLNVEHDLDIKDNLLEDEFIEDDLQEDRGF